MNGSAQPEDRFPAGSTEDAIEDTIAGTDQSSAVGSVGDRSNGNRALGETELDSALQLLVERAQYITGATGTALALPQGEEMVCRASAGSSAPAVGARLQVRSGLTGESIARRQLLRCDNAESDPRVNLETCRALGIASIVVLPLLRRSGEVRGLFELFSDHPYAFEERDLIALERMADLTLTALDLAEQRQNFAAALAPRRELGTPVESPAAGSVQPVAAIPIDIPIDISTTPEFAEPTVLPVEPGVVLAEPPVVRAEPPVIPAEPPALRAEPLVIPAEPTVLPAAPSLDLAPEPKPEPTSVPEAMLRVQKCASCGFPVSEGRTLCLDCEKKDTEKTAFEKKQREQEQGKILQQEIERPEQEEDAPSDSVSASATPEEFVPAFLANAVPPQESWLADHVNLLAVVVLVLGILVAVVVFR
jgi:putative methionine-R-sulfoxide reductase with GAF domain